jgi:hypothetical protein
MSQPGYDPAAAQELFEKLGERFLPTEVKKNPKGFDYIDIATTLERFNKVLGPNWSSEIKSVIVQPINPAVDGVGVRRKGGEVPGYLAVVSVVVACLGVFRSGVGSHVEADPDMAVKTALAEALKKAGHSFGVGLYLWDEAERFNVAEGQRAAVGDINALKNQVTKLAVERGIEKNAKAIADHFKIKETDLQNAEVLTKVLKEAGRL